MFAPFVANKMIIILHTILRCATVQCSACITQGLCSVNVFNIFIKYVNCINCQFRESNNYKIKQILFIFHIFQTENIDERVILSLLPAQPSLYHCSPTTHGLIWAHSALFSFCSFICKWTTHLVRFLFLRTIQVVRSSFVDRFVHNKHRSFTIT